MASEGEEYLAVLKASYEYDPQSDDEIKIEENQILLLLERVDDDWWKVKIKGETQEDETASGLVPAAYLEPADPTSKVKALYDYEAASPGELTITEDEPLKVFDTDGDWLLVESEKGKAGYVPSNYVEESTGEEPAAAPAAPAIVVPPSPPRPKSTYVDPADRVATTKAAAVAQDDIKTWSVSEVDAKGKKKKGTLGVGNGSLFFASESDKTPVQKWATTSITNVAVEKGKHVHLMLNQPPNKLHFNAGSKDTAEAINTKIESSRSLAAPSTPTASAPPPSPLPAPVAEPELEPEPEEELAEEEDHEQRGRSLSSSSAGKIKNVHFSPAPAAIIPRSPSIDETASMLEAEAEEERAAGEGEQAVALYDFTADGPDELSVVEGEELRVLTRSSPEWWMVRNAHGAEGEVPASYVEVVGGEASAEPATAEEAEAEPEDDGEAERERERQEAERKAREKAAERKRMEDAQRARTAEIERKRKEKEEREREAEVEAETEAEAEREKERQREREKERERERRKKEPARREAERARSPPPESSRTQADSKRGPPPGKTRVWHDRTGQFRVEAAFLGYNNGKIRLHKVNGVVIEVPSEKMSNEDMKFVHKLTGQSKRRGDGSSDDDQPLAERRKSLPPQREGRETRERKKVPKIDWFEFFLNAGCDIDDCTRYAAAFERDKIDEAILPDITDGTMRSLGLREGDIIRVGKAIGERRPKAPEKNGADTSHDEELAKQLQAEEQRKRSPAPNLFAGPGGTLKNNTAQRRGRPQPSKTLPPPSVDLISLNSDQPRTDAPTSTSPVQPPPRSSSAQPQTQASGFDDDAWTNRPSSTRPIAPTPPAAQARAPSAPPTATTTAAPPAPTPAPVPPVPAAPERTGSGLARTTESDIFDQLARLSELRTKSPPQPAPAPAISPAVTSPPPASYQAGLGMGSSPSPIGQLHQNTPPPQPPANGPRGPYAPVPQNQSLLQPLVPTTTGFNSFVPTRPGSNITTSPFNPPPPQPFIPPQQTGFPGQQSLISQPTGFSPQPLYNQPTGLPNGGFGQNASPFQNQPTGFGGVQSNPTGFRPPGFGDLPFNNGLSSPPPVPPLPQSVQQNNSSPANIFAQMKSGAFANGNEHQAPQNAEKYDALRPPPIATQPTGWGYQGGYQGGYMGYQR